MSPGYPARIQLGFILFFIITIEISSQVTEGPAVRLFFYNTENFFDIEDDTATDDDDFLPGGLMRWNWSRFSAKINSVYKVLMAAGEWAPPALAGFCEIENRYVLEKLIYDTYLSKYNYGIVHYQSSDPRGIDVGLIYRREVLTLVSSRTFIPEGYNRADFRTRDVLYAKFLAAADTIHIFLNHWPSRRRGVLAGENDRRKIAEMIKGKADSICSSVNGAAKIIVAGDFNSNPDDKEMMILSSAGQGREDHCSLVNLSGRSAGREDGTYKYRGTWEMLDQVLVSEMLLRDDSGLYTGTELLTIFSPEFLLAGDVGYPGYVPFSTYRGYRYQGGFSDHLPVILDLRIRK